MDRYIHKNINIFQEKVELENIISFCKRKDKRLTALQLLEIWIGKGKKEYRPENLIVAKHSREMAQDILGYLIVNKYLGEEFHFTSYSTISYISFGRSNTICSKIDYDYCTEIKPSSGTQLSTNKFQTNESKDEDSSKFRKKAKLESENFPSSNSKIYQSTSTSTVNNNERKQQKSDDENKKWNEKFQNLSDSIIILD